jgi:endoglucanase
MILATLLAMQVAGCAPDGPPAEKPNGEPEIVRGFNISVPGGNTLPDARTWGINVVRLQIFPQYRAKQWHMALWDAWPRVLDTVETALKVARENHIKVIVDLHEAPVEGLRTDRAEFWNSPDLAKNFCRAWTDLVTRLAPYREDIWGYDLYNEPLDWSQMPNAPRQWRGIAEQIIRTIRRLDRTTWVIYEPGPGSQFYSISKLEPLSDRRVVYSGHFYYPDQFTAQGTGAKPPFTPNVHYPGFANAANWNKAVLEKAAEPLVKFQEQHHVPIYIGEFSVIRWAPHDDAIHWLNDVLSIFEAHKWSWTYQTFRDWNGWSLENDEKPPTAEQPDPPKVNYLTDRGKVIKEALAKNHTR